MRKDKLYFLTFLSIAVIYTAIAGIALQYLIKASTYELFEAHLKFSKKEAKSFAILVGYQLANGIPKDSVINYIQGSLKGTDFEMGFLSMYDWSGRVVCHPDIKKVGQQASTNESFVFEITGAKGKIDAFVSLMEPLGLVEVSRTGAAAIAHGAAGV